MKNVTIALDDNSHRLARIYAAGMGTSLSALVKDYLLSLADGAAPVGRVAPLVLAAADGNRVREMPMQFDHHMPPTLSPTLSSIAAHAALPVAGYGVTIFTKDGKPRQPGAMRPASGWTDLSDEWPEGFWDEVLGKSENHGDDFLA